MAGKFVLKTAKNGKFYFNLNAGNGETILTSEMYVAKASALKGIDSVKTNSPLDGRYVKLTSKSGKPYFNLKAANGQVIGNGEQYSSESARDAGIESVKRNGPSATTDDQT
jgi:uncharacterized protein